MNIIARSLILITIFWAVLFLPLSLSADSPGLSTFACVDGSPQALSTADSLKSMENVQRQYSRVSSFRADFYQISEMAALEIEERSEGAVYFLRPGMMKWHYSEPREQIFLFKDQVISLYQPSESQLLIDDAREIFITDLPVSFIMGAGDLDENFEVIRACRNESGTVLVMRPRDDSRDSQLNMFHLLVDPRSHFPRGALIRDVGGNSTAILLRNEEIGIVLSDTDFSLKAPPGTDVLDRRRVF